jgi:hypothetical protein
MNRELAPHSFHSPLSDVEPNTTMTLSEEFPATGKIPPIRKPAQESGKQHAGS